MKPDTERRHNEKMCTVLRYISAKLDDSLSLTELARLANCAPFHFHRIFRELVGDSLHQYIRNLRLEWAAYRLLFTDRSILHIALDAGYDSHEAFTRAFKQEFGYTPATFRRRSAERARHDPEADGRTGDGLVLGAARPRSSEIRVGALPRRKVVFYRYFGPPSGIRGTWDRLAAWLRGRGVPSEGVEAIGIVYDGPEHWIGSRIRYDACAAVPPDFVPSGDIGTQMLPEGESMMAVHRGPAELTVHTYIRLVSGWVLLRDPRRFRHLPFYEVYQGIPHAERGEEVQAEIHVALEEFRSAGGRA